MAVGSSRPEPLPQKPSCALARSPSLSPPRSPTLTHGPRSSGCAQEQAALRRVATLVAQGAETGEVFAAVAHEVSQVMHLPVAALLRYEDDGGTMTVIAAWSDRPHPFQPGSRWPVHGSRLAAQVRQTGRAGRVEDYSHRQGIFAAKARELGLYSVAAAPIIVDGAVWGLVTIASNGWADPRARRGSSRRVHRAGRNRHREHSEPGRAIRFARPDRRRRGRDAAASRA